MRHTVTVLLAIFLVSCGIAGDPGPSAADLVAAAREAYIDMDLLTAGELAAEAARLHPDDPEAAVWNARMLTALNVLDEAVVAGDRAVELAPDDPQAWVAQLRAYAQGGIYRGNREWLDRAIEIAPETIRRFPNKQTLYDSASSTAGAGLSRPELYTSMLAELAPEIGDSPMFRYRYARDQLDTARRVKDEERVTELETAERRELEDLAGRTDPPLSTFELWHLAYGFNALDDEKATDVWLEALEARPDGAPLAARLISYRIAMQIFRSQEGLERKLAMLQEQRAGFDPEWFVEHDVLQSRYAGTWYTELNLLSWALRRGEVEDLEVREQHAQRVGELAMKLSRAAFLPGAMIYAGAGDALSETGLQPALAIALAEDGLEALDTGRPGFMYPGNREDQTAKRAAEYRASYLRWRGLAKAQLGDQGAGEADLLAAIETRPSGQAYLALADYHRQGGRPSEAYDAYLSALAWGIPAYLKHLQEPANTHATEALAELGRDAAELESDLETRVAEVDVAKHEEAIGSPLGRPAPDFELTDLNDRTWHLSDLRGTVVVINFWATWCGPCRAEMPHYTALIDEYADQEDIVFLAISQDDGTAEVVEYLTEHGYDFIVLMDEGISNDYHVTGVPTHFMVGKDGLIQYATTGFSGSGSYNSEMRWRIEALLNGLDR